MQTHPNNLSKPGKVGFKLAFNGTQYYAFANLARNGLLTC